jgi:ABC-2 type transport system ATP-binding protein
MRVADLSAGYAPGAVVLRGVSFALEPGTITAVLGPNGGGKTTLFRALLGDLPVREGVVELDGPPAYVPQTDRTRLDFPVSALDVVLMGAYGRTPAWRRVARADREAARAALDRVGLADRARRRFGALSGGQRQRVLLAVALAGEPPLLLLDEPTAAMDVEGRRAFWTTMRDLAARGTTVVFATHHLEEADAVADRVVVMAGGRVVADGPSAGIRSAVAGRTVRFSAPDGPAFDRLPGVTGVDRLGGTVALATTDVEATLRGLLDDGVPLTDLEVRGASLEDAVLSLTTTGVTR